MYQKKTGAVSKVRYWNLWVSSVLAHSFLKSSQEPHAVAAIIVSKSIASLLEVIGTVSLDRLLLRTCLFNLYFLTFSCTNPK